MLAWIREARLFARARRSLDKVRRVLFDTYERFAADDGDLLAGGIAFFAVLSLAPTLVIALALASTLLGTEAVSGALVAELRPMVGGTSAHFVSEVIERSHRSGASGPAALLGALVTIYASTRVFVQVQSALNRMWGISQTDADATLKQRAFQLVRKRIVSFGLVLGLGFLLAVIVGAKTALAYVAATLNLPHVPLLWRAADLLLSFVSLVAVLAAIYRILPDASIAWSHAFRGGLMTAAGFALGGMVVGIYFEYAHVGSAFGAAGSLVVFMLSAYYFAQIFLFGAELTGAVASQPGATTRSSTNGARS